jgi:oligoendopeptidase F
MAIKREEQKESATWDLKKIYHSNESWEKNFQEMNKKADFGWKEVLEGRGKLNKEAEKTLDAYFEISRALEKLYTYAHLHRDVDLSNHFYKEMFDKIETLYHDFSHKTAWLEPEILQSDVKISVPKYAFYLEKLYKQKDHILSGDKEEILALAGQMKSVPQKAFSLFNNADLTFPKITDENGEEHELTHSLYHKYMKGEDRKLRENAFKTMHQTFHKFENTVSELVSGQVQTHIFTQKVRNYENCVTAALTPHHIPVSVYRNLIETVRENLKPLHDYVKMRKEILGVDKLHYWDLMVPLVKDCDKLFSYEEAVEITIDSVAILGKEYCDRLRAGLQKDRWVDVYENKGKRSGAYSSGSYDTMPYILLNYQGTISDLLTLSHEAGHSMHSLYSHLGQPYHYSHYPIFLAEIASTFHERLTYEHLLSKMDGEKERSYLINQQIEGIRTTFFRQTMFAEFELTIHELAEKKIPLTPGRLKEEYRKLNHDYFGSDLIIDEELTFEYMRIPHFYYNFYVYQYATGIAAAYALVDKVKLEGPEKYLQFLSSGGSQYPIEILKKTGLDISKKESLLSLLNTWKNLLAKNLTNK